MNPLVDSYAQQPLYLNSDTQTNYRYIYKFEISQDQRLLSELEFLKIVGLQDRFDKIVSDYNAEVDEYNRIVEGNKPYVVDKYIKNKHIRINESQYKGLKLLKFVNFSISGYVAYWGISSIAKVASPPNDNPDLISHYTKTSIYASVYLFLSYKIHKWLINNDNNKLLVKNIIISPPQLTQTLSSSQLEAIANAYNRSLYDEILNK